MIRRKIRGGFLGRPADEKNAVIEGKCRAIDDCLNRGRRVAEPLQAQLVVYAFVGAAVFRGNGRTVGTMF